MLNYQRVITIHHHFSHGENSSLVLRTNEKIDEALMRISLVANDPVGRCGAWEQWMVFLFFFKGENGDFMVLMVI
jgi:hypothetical protein